MLNYMHYALCTVHRLEKPICDSAHNSVISKWSTKRNVKTRTSINVGTMKTRCINRWKRKKIKIFFYFFRTEHGAHVMAKRRSVHIEMNNWKSTQMRWGTHTYTCNGCKATEALPLHCSTFTLCVRCVPTYFYLLRNLCVRSEWDCGQRSQCTLKRPMKHTQ